MEDNFLTQHVDEPTHTSGNVLDLVISKDDQLIQNVSYEGRLGKSDHEMIITTVKMEMVDFDIPTRMRNYNLANFGEMRKEVGNVDWESALDQAGVEESWSIIKRCLEDLVDKWVPWKRPRKGRMAPKWMNAEVRKAVNEKKKAWKRWKTSGREEDK